MKIERIEATVEHIKPARASDAYDDDERVLRLAEWIRQALA